jgi:hypothetical protein
MIGGGDCGGGCRMIGVFEYGVAGGPMILVFTFGCSGLHVNISSIVMTGIMIRRSKTSTPKRVNLK